MPSRFGTSRPRLHPHAAAVMEEMRETDPELAVRKKARQLAAEFQQFASEPPPFNMELFASYRGLRSSDESPRHSEDSEIVPEPDGGVVLRVNRDRPFTRQRFSIGHEVGHTLFPEFTQKIQCRKPKDRAWADPYDHIESLCDIAASEFLFPLPWFQDRMAATALSAEVLAALAEHYHASREATIRRYVEIAAAPLAAVFFSWKLKPTEKSRVKQDRSQGQLFGAPPKIERKIRVDYAILNAGFESQAGSHIPKDKSIESDGPIYLAASEQICVDDVCFLNLGPVRGRFKTHAMPNYTTGENLGPKGEFSVAAVIEPVG